MFKYNKQSAGVGPLRQMIIDYMVIDHTLPPDTDVLRQLLNNVTTQERVTLIKQLTKSSVAVLAGLKGQAHAHTDIRTCVIIAAVQNHTEMFNALFENLDGMDVNSLFEDLVDSRQNDKLILSNARLNDNTVDSIFGLMRRMDNGNTKNHGYAVILIETARLGTPCLTRFEEFYRELSSDMKCSFLKGSYGLAQGFTNIIALQDDPTWMTLSLSGLSNAQVISILSQRSACGQTPLHTVCGVRFDRSAVVRVMLENLSIAETGDLLLQKDTDCNTAVHTAASVGNIDLIRSLRIDELDNRDVAELLLARNSKTGLNALDYARQWGNRSALKYFKLILDDCGTNRNGK